MPEGESLPELAQHHCTLCLFLSITLLKKVQVDLLEAGWSPDAPVLVVHKASWPGEEKIIRGTLTDIREKCRAEKINSQAMIIVSPTLGARDWTELKKSKLYDKSFSHRFRKAAHKNSGRENRKARLTNPSSGVWASSSQDYLRLATMLYEHSATYARSVDGNCSPYPLVGLPLLCSILRAVLIEANNGMYGVGRDKDALKKIAGTANEIPLLTKKYRLSEKQNSRLLLLYEVRNEIVHPSHMPAGTPHGTPNNMIGLRKLGLLQSKGAEDSDYVWLSQLESHRLFRWAFETIEDTAAIILKEHYPDEESLTLHMQSYTRYRQYDS